jgi:2-polyprenyl-3-methyl-5-hydroxy-6-metoxy-1,4-benzoquinol methylase
MSTAHPDNEGYWIERHKSLQGQLASVGNIGSTQADNMQRYARKKRRIVSLMRALGRDNLEGAHVLDAGCGIGMISEILYALGANVSGVDASEAAIEEAANRCPGGGKFVVGSLVNFSFARKFDAIFCLDVLYHVLDDENWQAVLNNFKKHLAPGGLLVLIDQVKEEPSRPAEHVRFRTEAMYNAALPGLTPCTPEGHSQALVYQSPPTS